MVMPPWASRVPVPLSVLPVPQVEEPGGRDVARAGEGAVGLDRQGAGGDGRRHDARGRAIVEVPRRRRGSCHRGDWPGERAQEAVVPLVAE